MIGMTLHADKLRKPLKVRMVWLKEVLPSTDCRMGLLLASILEELKMDEAKSSS